MRVGILGAGGMGNVHARHYRTMPDVELAFFDPQDAKATTYAAKWSAVRMESEEKLRAWADIVDVCLPTQMHLNQGLAAIAAGKAVLMEKPMALTFAEASKLAQAAEAAGTPFMPAQVVRYFPEFSTAHQLVVSGKIGKPGTARIRRGGGAPKGEDLWFMDHTRSGGVLIDLAVHDFDWLRWTFGEVKTVVAQSLGAKTGQGPDYALTILQFDSGVVAHVESTWMDPAGYRATLDVSGSDGRVFYDSRQVQTVRTSTPGAQAAEAPLAPSDDPYFRQLRAFVDAVAGGTPPPVSGRDGALAVGIAEAAPASAVQGVPVAPPRL